MKTQTINPKTKTAQATLPKQPRLRVALFNPRPPAKAVRGYVEPEVFTCDAIAQRHQNIYSADLGGCHWGISFSRGAAFIQLSGKCQEIGSATLVWHKIAAASTWQSEIAKGQTLNGSTDIPQIGRPTWRRPSRLPWVAINLDPAFVKKDRQGEEVSMARGLFVCVSHAILEQVARLADPGTGILPPQRALDLKFIFPVFDPIAGQTLAKQRFQASVRNPRAAAKAIAKKIDGEFSALRTH